jgi:hypothetical protein
MPSPSYDAVGSVAGTNIASGISWTHTPIGTPTLAIAWVCAKDGSPMTDPAATYGGVSMVGIPGASGASGTQAIAGFYLLSPPPGAQSVVASWVGPVQDAFIGFSKTYTAAYIAPDGGTFESGSGTNNEASVGGTTINDVVEEVVAHAVDEVENPLSGQTEDTQRGVGAAPFHAATAHMVALPVSTALDYGWATSSNFTHAACRIPSSGGSRAAIWL